MIKLTKLIKENIVSDIIDSGKFSIVIGSSTWTDSKPTYKDVMEAFQECILHYFVDWDFYHNYDTYYAEKYLSVVKDQILYPYLNNLDNFVKKFMDVKNNTYQMKKSFNQDKFIRTYIKKSSRMPDLIKGDYYSYYLDYTGKKPW